MEKEVSVFACERSDDAAADCEHADLGRVLKQQLDRLAEPQQQVSSLAFLKSMGQREIARITQKPPGTVKTRMELGLRKLRSILLARVVRRRI